MYRAKPTDDEDTLYLSPRSRELLRQVLRLEQLDGEGELVGTRQHGLAQFKVAELPRDAELLERARAHAQRIAGEDPQLAQAENALLADALVAAYGGEARAPIRA